MNALRTTLLATLVVLLGISPLTADVITAREERQQPSSPGETADAPSNAQTISEHALAVENHPTLTDQDVRYFTDRPQAVQLAGQEGDTYDYVSGTLWIVTTLALTAWYISVH